jgi:hypothetical protein
MLVFNLENIDIHALSKLLHFIGWKHELIFNSNISIWRFTTEPLLVYTDCVIQHCNVDAIIVSNICYNTSGLPDYIKQIALNYKVKLADADFDDIDTCIYHHLKCKTSVTQQSNGILNLPVVNHILARNSKYELLRTIYAYRFKKIGMHSLAICMYNTILALHSISSSTNVYMVLPAVGFFNNMVLY